MLFFWFTRLTTSMPLSSSQHIHEDRNFSVKISRIPSHPLEFYAATLDPINWEAVSKEDAN